MHNLSASLTPTTKTPTVSIIMPVWNGETYLREAIDSILHQTFTDFEFLILDDGSTDSSPEILKEYSAQDPRIRIISLDHQGIVVALNRGVAEAKAEWIARMDCDDIAYPERLERQWAAIQEKSDSVLCYTQIKPFGEEPYVFPAARFTSSEALIRLRLCYHCPISHPTVMFQKKAFLECGGYLPAERHAEDYALWGRLIEHGAVVGVSMPMLSLRVHHSSISKQKADVQISLSQKIALHHCRQFMALDQDEAQRALDALNYLRSESTLRDWFWLISHCLPRLKRQDAELWIWAVRKTILRAIHTIKG